MKIWIVNYYTSAPDKVSNPRYVEFAKHFMDHGWEVITFNANHTSIENKNLFERKQYGDYDFVHVKVPKYKGNGIKRMWSIFKFSWLVYRHAKDFSHPDVVLHNIHMPFDYPIVWAANKLKSKYIAESWDCWPEDFVASGLISANNPIMKFAYYVEKQCFYHADSIIFTGLGLRTRLIQNGWTTEKGGKIDSAHIHYINNGVNLVKFDNDKERYPRKDYDLNSDDHYKIIYLGSINGANNVITLIEAAELMKDDPRYKFYIYGDGSKRAELEEMVSTKDMGNVVFKERRVPFQEVAWIVSKATVNIMNYEKGFGRWGVSSGKLFLYLAAGKPIICNVDIKYDNVISDNNLGVSRDLETAEDFANSIKIITQQSESDYRNMCCRVRECAKRFDYKELAKSEIAVIESLFK